MNCSKCGATLPEAAKFCNKCGTRVAEAPAQQPPAPPSPDPGAAAVYPQPTPPPAAAPPPQAGQPQGQPFATALSGDWVAAAPDRLRRILLLDQSVFAELRTDTSATVFSLLIAAAAIFITGLGGYVWMAVEFESDWEIFWKSALVGSLLGFILWLGWALAAYVLLANVFREAVRPDEVLRVAGAAAAPLALGFFMFIPGISFGVALAGIATWVVYTVMALQAGFGLSMDRAALAGLGGFAVWALVMPLIVSNDNPMGPGILLFDALKDVFV